MDLPLPLFHHQRVLVQEHQLVICETLVERSTEYTLESPLEKALVYNFRYNLKKMIPANISTKHININTYFSLKGKTQIPIASGT